MKITRRSFMATGAASLLASPAFAQTRIGDMTVLSLSDGNLMLPANMILGDLAADKRAALETAFGFTDTLTPPCNVTLLQTGDRNVLFDVGAGPEFMSSAGFLMDALDAQRFRLQERIDKLFRKFGGNILQQVFHTAIIGVPGSNSKSWAVPVPCGTHLYLPACHLCLSGQPLEE